MKTIKHISFALLLTLAFTTVYGQTGQSRVDRYAETFSMTEEQKTLLSDIYEESSIEEQELTAKMVDHRKKLQTSSRIPEENAGWKEEQNALSLERKALTEKRETAMLEIFTEDQAKAWKAWKSGELTWKEIPAHLAD